MRLDCGVAGETGADVECMCFQDFFYTAFIMFCNVGEIIKNIRSEIKNSPMVSSVPMVIYACKKIKNTLFPLPML